LDVRKKLKKLQFLRRDFASKIENPFELLSRSAESLLDGRRCSWMGQIMATLYSCGMSGEWNGRGRQVEEASKQVILI
jgi:hypothetical protein